MDCLKIVHTLIQITPQLDPRPTVLLFVQILMDLMREAVKKCFFLGIIPEPVEV